MLATKSPIVNSPRAHRLSHQAAAEPRSRGVLVLCRPSSPSIPCRPGGEGAPLVPPSQLWLCFRIPSPGPRRGHHHRDFPHPLMSTTDCSRPMFLIATFLIFQRAAQATREWSAWRTSHRTRRAVAQTQTSLLGALVRKLLHGKKQLQRVSDHSNWEGSEVSAGCRCTVFCGPCRPL